MYIPSLHFKYEVKSTRQSGPGHPGSAYDPAEKLYRPATRPLLYPLYENLDIYIPFSPLPSPLHPTFPSYPSRFADSHYCCSIQDGWLAAPSSPTATGWLGSFDKYKEHLEEDSDTVYAASPVKLLHHCSICHFPAFLHARNDIPGVIDTPNIYPPPKFVTFHGPPE